MDEESLKALKVADLKAELAKLNLPVSGKKEELIKRLLAHPQTATTETTVPPPAKPTLGNPLAEEAKAARAARFGIPLNPSTSADATSKDAMAARAARFGQPPALGEAMSVDRQRERAARFGETVSGSLKRREEEEAKAARKARFGLQSK